MIDQGIGGTGRALSAEYREMLMQEPLQILREADFEGAMRPWCVKKLEAADTGRFGVSGETGLNQKKKTTSLWPKYHL